MLYTLWVIVLTALVGASAHAQCPPPSPNTLAEGEIDLFFDPEGTQTCVDVPPSLPFQLYVVARVPEGAVAEYEAPTLSQVSGSAVILNRIVAVNPGYEPLIVVDGCPTARRTDPSMCPVSRGDLLPLSVVEVFAFPAPVTGTYCFDSACESIIGQQVRPPWYRHCDDGTLQSFTGGESMCVGIGESVSVQSSTWALVKRLYRDE